MTGYRAHICQCLGRISTFRRDSPVSECEGRRKTGKELVTEVLAIAGGLTELGLRPGEVVAVAALNSDFYLEWMLAITFVGGIVAPLNYRWSLEEVKAAMESASPAILVVDEQCKSWAPKLWGSIPSVRFHLSIDPSVNIQTHGIIARCVPESQEVSIFDFQWSPKSIAIICFTSGTTGRPKGVALSHAALVVQSLAKLAVVGYNEDDVYLHTAPLCHIGGISSALAMLMVGACHVVMPKFSAELAFQFIEQHSVTSFITVPAMMADLVSFSGNLRIGGSVRRILNGGGRLSQELCQKASQAFPNAKLLSAYGMTEACSSITFMTLYNPEKQGTSASPHDFSSDTGQTVPGPSGICVGKPPPHVEIQIRKNGKLVNSFVAGSILTRGMHVMDGYWCNAPDNLSPVFCKCGWLETGDIGWVDDYGNLWLQGRSKDRIKSGGENIYPEEVEAVLLQHPGILESVIVGIPDTRLSEAVAACIRVKTEWNWIDGNSSFLSPDVKSQNLSCKILQSHCKRMHLSGFKIPKIFIPWKKSFPSTSSGKLMRDKVKEEAMAHLQALHSNL
ncbi:2-succinylbenzoate--CoA ligase, chloroplastic/peroxisomal [Nymphaea colorata]|nr:2-succinylbenzoate--CoA ligase, chloroplastic/peroxisomal [Nymphaea colorata]